MDPLHDVLERAEAQHEPPRWEDDVEAHVVISPEDTECSECDAAAAITFGYFLTTRGSDGPDVFGGFAVCRECRFVAPCVTDEDNNAYIRLGEPSQGGVK